MVDVRLAVLAGIVACSCGGCQQLLGLHDLPSDASVRDASGDAPTDAPGCYGVGFGRVCITPPTGPTTLSGTLNTDSSGSCVTYTAPTPFDACVIAGTDVTVADVAVVGSRPLLIVGTQHVTIDGRLGVASHQATGQSGAGADPTSCATGTLPINSGGGAGGSYGTVGASGGKPGAGGSPGAAQIVAMRGGCAGQRGAGGNSGAGGAGGGAVYVIAGVDITIASTGSIDASGAGGGGPPPSDQGAGGGGSGGLVGLDAPTVTNDGKIFANGGGGGGGSDGGNAGQPGGDPTSPTMAAPGGVGGGAGGAGGAGAAGASAPSAGLDGNGGGGGGGGLGFVKLFGAGSIGGSGSISPTPS